MEKDNLKEIVEKVKRQTNMENEEIERELEANNYDYMKVIHNYYKIEKKEREMKTINQEIYHQIRTKMDNIVNEYNAKKNEEKMEKK